MIEIAVFSLAIAVEYLVLCAVGMIEDYDMNVLEADYTKDI